MSTDETIPQKPSFGRRFLLAMKRLFLFLLRVCLTLLVLGAVGTAIYLGAPVLIDEYLLKDVKINSSQLRDISADLETNSEITSEKLADLQIRLGNLEIQGDSDKQAMSDMGAQLAASEIKLQEQAESIHDFDAVRASLDEYAGSLTSLEERISEYESDMEKIQDELATLNHSAVGNTVQLETLNARFEAREPALILRQDLALLKVMEIVTRVRVSIGDGNFGLAKDDLDAAQELLISLTLDLPADQVKYLDTIADRLNLASNNLIQAPTLVDQDLEAAWQLLLQGLPVEVQTDELTTTPTPTPQP